jgi:hypothetical protein
VFSEEICSFSFCSCYSKEVGPFYSKYEVAVLEKVSFLIFSSYREGLVCTEREDSFVSKLLTIMVSITKDKD